MGPSCSAGPCRRDVPPEDPANAAIWIDRAARLVAQGGLVAFPTDTVYGLGADVMNVEALSKLFEAKGRAPGQPVPVLLADAEDAVQVAEAFPEGAKQLASRFWPGPLTLVLRRRSDVPPAVGGGGAGIGVRVPDHETPRAIVRAVGRPITGTSANTSGQPPHRDAASVALDLGDWVDLLLPGQCGRHRTASTVVDFTRDVPVIVREGPIAPDELATVWPDIRPAPDGRLR